MKKDELLHEALEAISNFVVVDKNGVITFMNQVYADMLGLPLSEIIGKKATDVIPGTRLMHILKDGHSEIGQVMSFYDHHKKKNVRLICNRLPLYRDGKVVGATAMTMLEDMDEINRLYRELEKTKAENLRIKKQLDAFKDSPLHRIIGNTAEMQDLKNTIAEFASSGLTILLTGETGVGKEVFANAIHQMSPRRDHPFIKINCAAIPADLLESELFGYEEGAFTGALKGGKAGKFELAHKGTLLLDEIGEMSAALQAKLLRALQEKEVERVGSARPKKIDVRVLCSTNVNLREQVNRGRFREDLYYRINTVELSIPPLRERLADLPLLCNYFIKKNNEENGLRTKGVDESVLDLFQRYAWPGNVRELQHVIERLSFLHQKDVITESHCAFLKKRIDAQPGLQPPTSAKAGAIPVYAPDAPAQRLIHDLHASRDAAEEASIRNALAQTYGNKSKAAALLGLSRSMFYVKLKKYGI